MPIENKPKPVIVFISLVFLFFAMIIAVIGLGKSFYDGAKNCEKNLLYCEKNIAQLTKSLNNNYLEDFVKECKKNNGTFEYYFKNNSSTVLEGLGCMLK